MPTIYTIGHSHHPLEAFLTLLRQHGIQTVADVRSSPRSRFAPQFNQERLRVWLQEQSLAYIHLPDLGGRPALDPVDGKRVSVWRLIEGRPGFTSALAYLRDRSQVQRIALLCAEHDPLECHRALLVGARLHDASTPVEHILRDGVLQSQDQLEGRLLHRHRLDHEDVLRDRAERVQEAYRRQAEGMGGAGKPRGAGRNALRRAPRP